MNSYAVSIITVNYGGPKCISRCIQSITQFSPKFPFEMIIIENGDPCLDLNGLPHWCRYIPRISNDGFSSACHYATALAKFNYFLFLNPDTEFTAKTNLASGIDIIREDEQIALMGCLLIDQNNNPIKISSRFLPKWYDHLLHQSILKYLFPQRARFITSANKLQCLTGAYMLFSKKWYNALDGFDKNYFMYWEDIDICKKAQSMGAKVKMDQFSSIIHHQGGTTAHKKANQHLLLYYVDSQIYYLKKWHSAPVRKFVYFMRGTEFFLKATFRFFYNFIKNKDLIFAKNDWQAGKKYFRSFLMN